MENASCKKMSRTVILLLLLLVPTILWAHAGPVDRYIAEIPSYRALTAIPSWFFGILHCLLIVGIVLYYLLHKFHGYTLSGITCRYDNLHENVKLLVTTLLLSLGLTPVLYISGSFYGMMILVVMVVAAIYFIALLFPKVRNAITSIIYTSFLLIVVAFQILYYILYYAFSLWDSSVFKELFNYVDQEEYMPVFTYYPEHAISALDLLENFACIAFLFLLSYGIYLLVRLSAKGIRSLSKKVV